MRAIVALLFSLAIVSCAIYDGITVKKALRNIDLTTQFSRQNISLTFSNTGSKAASEVYLALESKFAKHLSLLDVFVESTGELLQSAQTDIVDREISGKKVSFTNYRVTLSKSLAPQGTIELRSEFIFTHIQTPFPTQITQTERQFVKYSDNIFVASPYVIQSQITTVKLASPRIESKTEQNPTSVKGDTITYGPYVDLQPYRYTDLSVHFDNSAPFITVTHLQKEYEISHWGNVAVEETYQLQHDGAKLKGAFSRYDYQRSGGNAPAHVPVLTQILPFGASDIYYRDEIGNISTSTVSLTQRGLTLGLTPRFPLFGGWKFGFYMGYNLPAQYYLFNDNQQSNIYVLNATFATNLDNAVIDELVVRVILPEGATEIEVHTPFSIDGKSSATHYTYLDTTGRPVVIVSKKNVVSEHNRYFQVTYKFSQFSLLQEPLLLIVAFFLFFLFIMVYVRLEFNIGPVKQARSANADKVDDLLLRVKDLLDQRAEHHHALDNALTKAIKSKNHQSYVTDKQRVDNNLALIKKDIVKSIAEADDLDGEVARKLREIEKKEEIKTRNQQLLHEVEVAQRFKKTTSKGVSEDSKPEYEKAFNTADEELESLVSDLFEDL